MLLLKLDGSLLMLMLVMAGNVVHSAIVVLTWSLLGQGLGTCFR